MRRLLLSLVLTMTGSATTAAAGELPYGNTLVFSAVRNGQTIGSHSLTFKRQPGQVVVETSIDLAVKVLGITAYRYMHRSQETWSGDGLQSLSTVTDDDGKKYAVRATQTQGGLVVESETRASLGRATVNDQGLLPSQPVREIFPSNIMPSTHWNVKQIGQSRLLNSQKGTLERIAVTQIGRETVKAAASNIEAMRYRYSGAIKMDQWFDDRGRWVKSAFVGSDGSTIEYILQE